MRSAEVKSQTGPLVAPFPYFGGKRRAAGLVWPRFGTVANYVEPFCGSLAVLLGAPSGHRSETVNDANGLIVNFWRAVQSAPDEVAKWADWPVTEIDLESRHGWLMNRAERLRQFLEDPDYFDPKIAGWWVWGACCWIGSGWCTGQGPWVSNGVEFYNRREFAASWPIGIKRALPHVGNAGMGIHRQVDGAGCHERHQYIVAWLRLLCDRVRHVRVLCGDWSRAVKPAVTVRHGMTAVFLDPPYGADNIAKGLYAQGGNVTADVRAWCAEHGKDPLLRIALCGYEGEYDLPGWTVVVSRATTGGGYGNTSQNANHQRERIWFSPHCVMDSTGPFVSSTGKIDGRKRPKSKGIAHDAQKRT
jgi:hypothetical protein